MKRQQKSSFVTKRESLIKSLGFIGSFPPTYGYIYSLFSINFGLLWPIKILIPNSFLPNSSTVVTFDQKGERLLNEVLLNLAESSPQMEKNSKL